MTNQYLLNKYIPYRLYVTVPHFSKNDHIKDMKFKVAYGQLILPKLN
jgi:hypothetical protein